MKPVNLTKKQKVWIIVGSVMAAIILFMSIFMVVCASKSIQDGTVPSGTLSLIGNLLRVKSNVDYQTFDNAAEFPVDNFRVSLSVMNQWENSTDILKYDYTYTDGTRTATDMKSLQEMYNYYGATKTHPAYG